jgi:hypothetical protein
MVCGQFKNAGYDGARFASNMARSESEYLLDLWDRNICPYCGQAITEGTRIGTGRKADGGFCSLQCYTRYYELDLRERARRLDPNRDS